MAPNANLTCFRVECGGEFRHVADDGRDVLFECQECGADLSQSGTEELADGDGPVAELAGLLLEGGPK